MFKKRMLSLFLVITLLMSSAYGVLAIEPEQADVPQVSSETLPNEEEVIEVFPTTELASISENPTSGTLESGNISWDFSGQGMLTLTGTGAMDDFSPGEAPWDGQKQHIRFIYISDGITSIGSNAFYGLSNARSLYIPESVTSIGEGAFEKCGELKEIALPDGLLSIGNSAFRECTKLKEVTIPSSVTSIGTSCFAGCDKLKEIKVESGNANYTSFDGVLFDKDQSVLLAYPGHNKNQTYTIPSSVTEIAEYAFDGCHNLSEITLSTSLLKIGSGAFNECDAIESITIPASVTEIAQDAFMYSLESLEEINVEAENTAYTSENGVLFNKDKTTLLRIPDAFTTEDATYVMPNSVKTIGQEAFFECQNIEKLHIPNSVKKIEMAAFMYFDSLTYIKYYGTKMDWAMIEKEVFNDILDDVEIEFLSNEFSSTYTMKVGQSKNILDVVDFGENEDIAENASYSSSNTAVASFDEDTLVAIAPGETIVTATLNKDGGVIAISAQVTVSEQDESDDFKSATFTMDEGETWSITENIDFSDDELNRLKYVKWATSDERVATIDDNNYVVTAVGGGSATIIATYTFGKTKIRIRVEITVKSQYSPAKDFEFANGTIIRYIGNDKIVKVPNQIGGVTVTAIGDYAFRNCNGVEKVVLPDTIKTIGYDAFSYCYNLSSINLNEGLTTIRSYAFYYCTSLLKITIPSTVNTTSYSSWFSGCSKLDTVIFASGITKTGAVLRGSNVRTVVLPSTLTEISTNAFASCYRLEKIDIPANVTTISTSAFDYCRGLREVNIPNTSKLTYIGNFAFYDCSFASIRLPEGLKTIGYSAFANSELERISLPGTVSSIGTGIFSGCVSLSDVTLGKYIERIPSYTFYNCSALKDIVLPSYCDGIGSYAFAYSGIHDISLGGTDYISAYAFYNCSNLTSIWMLHVYDIDDYAFYNCTNLATIVFSANEAVGLLRTIGDSAFGYCQKLTEIDLPDGVTSIGNYAFRNCSKLKSIDLGNSLTSIPSFAFYNCSALTKLTVPGSVTNLGSNIFGGCRNISEVILGEGITAIPSYAFYYCSNLKKIALPNSVKTIGSNAFSNCRSLEEIHFGNGLTSIDSYAFAYCFALKSIELPVDVRTIGVGAFFCCSSLKYVTLNRRLNRIEGSAFAYCTELPEIDIPASVTYIGRYAFAYDSSLRSVTIGNGASYLDLIYVFYCCPWNPREFLISASYTTEENTGMSYIPLKVKYEFKEGAAAFNKVVKITLPTWAFLVSGSMKFNGKIYKNYEESQYDGSDYYASTGKSITIPVDANVGEIDFCIKPSEYTAISTTAEISYSLPVGGRKTETIGTLNSTLPAISVSAPDITGSASVVVEGVAIPRKTVSLYIDGVFKGTVTSSSTGTYKKTITISNPENHRIYAIRAEVNNNGKVSSDKTDIQYVANSPTLTGLKLHYYGKYSSYWSQRDEVYDLYNSNSKYIQWGYSGSYAHSAKYYRYHFTVNVSNRSQVDKVYVVSTRDGHKEYLEAKWDANILAYKTSGYFANDWSYIPNNITVEYTKKIDNVKLTLSDMLKYMDFGTGNFLPSINDYTSTSYSASVKVFPLLSPLFGDRIDVSSEITDVDYSKVTNETLYPDVADYYSFPITQGNKNCVVSFDLTDSTNAVIYLHDKKANKQIAYTMAFVDVDEDGNETKRDVNTIFENIDSYTARFKNFHDLNVDIDAIIEGLSKSAIDESQLLELIQKAQNLEVKRNMFILSSVVLAAANMNNISAPVEIIDYIKALINADIKFFGDLKLAITYRIGNEYKIRWKIDPSGYVYEGVTDNRLEGVKTTLFCVANENIPKNEDGSYNFDAIDEGNIAEWNAEEWDQVNPLLTDAGGAYRWDVPDGYHWQVKYELEGYDTEFSEWLPVPPVQENVNIGLVSDAVPTVEEVKMTPEYAAITFSKYMDPTSVKNVQIGDLSYTIDYDKTKTDLEGNNFAKEFVFKFDAKLDSGKSYEISVTGAKSYAGMPMEDYSANATVLGTNELVLTNVGSSEKDINYEYINNTNETKNFNVFCAIYDENHRLIDLQREKIENLLPNVKFEHKFVFENDWVTYKIFTWDIEMNAKPLLKEFDSSKNEN